MKRIRSADQDYKPPGQWTMEGFLYVQEKRESFQPGSQPAKPSNPPSLIIAWFYIHHHKHVWSSPRPLQKISSHTELIIHPVYRFTLMCSQTRGEISKWQIFINTDKQLLIYHTLITNRFLEVLPEACDSEKHILAQPLFLYFSVLGPLGCTWTRHYCTYEKGSKTFTMSNTETKSAGKQVVQLRLVLFQFSLVAHKNDKS